MSTHLDMIPLCSGDPAFVARWKASCVEGHHEEQRWIAGLRASGVKAAHPNDGWVDREANTVVLCYPQFNDGVKVGDTIALGSASDNEPPRIIKVIEVEVSKFFPELIHYHFKP